MYKRKIMAIGLVVGLTISSLPIESMANTLEEYETIKEEKKDDSSEVNFFENIIKNLFVRKSNYKENKESKKVKEIIKVNKNIVRNSVLEIVLNDGQFVQDLSGNPNGYETVRVITNGSKKLVEADYDNLRLSGIPKVDLSGAQSDSIPEGAFYNATHLVEFNFPQGVLSISETSKITGYKGAFYGCKNLSGELVIPSTVKIIGPEAYDGCASLTGSLVIPDSVTEIGYSVFDGCSGFNGTLTLSKSLKVLPSYAFRNCRKFTGDLVIPDNIIDVRNNAFDGCSGFNGTLTLSKNLPRIDSYVFQGCSNLTGNLVLPEGMDYISYSAFNRCSGFTGDLVIPSGIETIYDSAFSGCTGFDGELVLPDTLERICEFAFKNCSGFTGDLVIPNSVTTIEESIFYGCSGFTGNLVISNNVRAIEVNSFEGCSGLTGDLVIPDNVRTIGDSSFKNCAGFNGNLVLGNSIQSIGVDSFEGCSGLTGDLVISDNVTSIGDSAFKNCAGFNGGLVISNSIQSIEPYTFSGCSAFTGGLIIPESVTSIGEYAFNGCKGFNGKLILGNSLETIGEYAFKNCSKLKGPLFIPDTLTSALNAFSGCTNITKIIVRLDEAYKDSNYRETMIKQLPVGKTYVEISYNFDVSSTWLSSSNYKKSVPTIMTYAKDFENNEGLGISLKTGDASTVKVITITKDGLDYNLEKDKDGVYVFTETGNYRVYIETELGTVSNIEFKNISPINAPGIDASDNIFNIIDNGIMSDKYLEDKNSSEDFNDVNDLKYNFSNSNWIIENGILKSETIGDDGITENEFKVNANLGDKMQIRVKTSSELNNDYGYIYINGKEAYTKSGITTGFQIVEFDLQEGENTIRFVYEKDFSTSKGDDAILIDYIKILVGGFRAVPCDTLEYRIDGGDWQVYTGSFSLQYPIGTKIQIEVRAKHDGYISEIFSKEVTIEFSTKSIEDAIEKAEQSKDAIDISSARDLVNEMEESSKKDIFQDRLNAIFPEIALEKETLSANTDIYIKFKNTLSLSIDTNVVVFEDYSGSEDLEMLGAVNLTVSSSLPYQINAYMPTEIANADGSKKMPLSVLNIKEGDETSYQVFKNTVDKLVLKSDCLRGEGNKHSIDLRLVSNQVYKSDVYKTVIKFEIEQN